ncbi:unnamed protein product [Rotaria socialis]|uniref:Cell wall hydrolase SleB domain-containing protein n=1 Tax=Rotaria socialis TaxID=392032 RepID=A0A817KVV2_9BILA|nr:unnamed protein product [Rotaria socialis]CAF3410037.1 unnamed protein product [Rotaria socialis]CAF3488626.1 unnamed protein product [Rotaria socialis]CAF3545551.1 unnamed protein product [Rotaria socialis]CAF3602132.1 unnamed protein product [Rotaria socialis]
MSHLHPLDVFRKTIYAEARGEPIDGQIWVAWVIKNRVRLNKDYWGGNSIKDVCLKPGQFECWNDRSDIQIDEPAVYAQVCEVVDPIYNANPGQDPTGGCDHYNCPRKEGYPPWTENCQKVRKIGEHQFYRGPQ